MAGLNTMYGPVRTSGCALLLLLLLLPPIAKAHTGILPPPPPPLLLLLLVVVDGRAGSNVTIFIVFADVVGVTVSVGEGRITGVVKVGAGKMIVVLDGAGMIVVIVIDIRSSLSTTSSMHAVNSFR